jgi:hypothetical protein
MAVFIAALLSMPAPADAGEINAFISTAIKVVTDELLPPFERGISACRQVHAPASRVAGTMTEPAACRQLP